MFYCHGVHYICMSTDPIDILGSKKVIQIRVQKLHTPVGTAEAQQPRSNQWFSEARRFKKSMNQQCFLVFLKGVGGAGGRAACNLWKK